MIITQGLGSPFLVTQGYYSLPRSRGCLFIENELTTRLTIENTAVTGLSVVNGAVYALRITNTSCSSDEGGCC